MKSNNRLSLAQICRLLAVGLLLLSVAAPAASAQVSFSAPTNYPVGTAPVAVAVGDFNGDGEQDLAAVNNGSGNVSILLGKGDGTFEAAVNYSVGGTASSPLSPTFVAVGDFDGDEKLDLAVANGSAKTVSILLGNGDGTFQAPVQYNVGASADYVAVADFNNDKKPDLMVSNAQGTISILLGSGDGSFSPAKITSTQGASPYVAIGDFNGDGKLDMATGNGTVTLSGNVIVLLGNGDGTFQSAITSAVNFYPVYLTSGDLNGDAKMDLAVVAWTFHENQLRQITATEAIPTLLGKDDGTFSVSASANLPGDIYCIFCRNPFAPNLVIADLNNDRRLDLIAPVVVPDPSIVGGQSSAIWARLGNGDGTFQPAQTFNLATAPSWLALGDFKGDNLPDLVVANSSANSISVLLNTTPSFTLTPASTKLIMQPGGQGSDVITIAGLNGFASTIELACAISGPAPTPTCSLSPASVTPGASSVTSTLTITAPAAAAMRLPFSGPQLSKFVYAVCLQLVFGIAAVGGSKKRRHGYWMLCGFLLTLLLVQAACGGANSDSGSSGGGTQGPTNYAVAITGTSGGLQHTTQVTVTVQ